MSVYQISRIQIRRGQKNETGIPQLASGEMAWAIDTQELYIGNGAVSEGAPFVGNTRILTENDVLLDLAEQYQYQPVIGFQTGVNANSPVYRSLQNRLDDQVTSASFGINTTDSAAITTQKIQAAINNLFTLNTISQTPVDITRRVELVFLPGEYLISSTIYIPSHVTIRGAGKDKTRFVYSGTGAVFEFVNNQNSTSIENFTTANQPRFCHLSGFTIVTSNENVEGLRLNCVKDSTFESLNIINTNPVPTTGIGISMYARSSNITCQDNLFVNITTRGFEDGIFSNDDIQLNIIQHCEFINLMYGIRLGYIKTQEYGPRNNVIETSTFRDIYNAGIIVSNGYGNRSRGNTFDNVANDGAGVYNSKYGQIIFEDSGNNSLGDSFDRRFELSTKSWDYPYVSEIEGTVYYRAFNATKLNLVYAVGADPESATLPKAFRLPVDASCSYEVEYVMTNEIHDSIRRGKIYITVGMFNSDSTITPSLSVTEEYDFAGAPEDENNVTFHFRYETNNNFDEVVVYYSNINQNDNTELTYTFTKLS